MTNLDKLIKDFEKVNFKRNQGKFAFKYAEEKSNDYYGEFHAVGPSRIFRGGFQNLMSYHDAKSAAEQDQKIIEIAINNLPKLLEAVKVMMEGLQFECGNRCAHQNPCNAKETLDQVEEIFK